MNILILGASSDIGIKLLETLKDKDYKIGAHCYKNDIKLKKFKKKFHSFKIFKQNLSSQKDSLKLFRSYMKWSKKIDVLVHLSGNVSKIKNWENLPEKNLMDDYKLNFSSIFFLVQKIFNSMKKKGGKILLTSTSSAIHGGGEDSFGYGLAKLNLLYLSKALARFGGKYNIISNCINPGYIDTKFHTKVMKRSRKDLNIRKTKNKLGRAGSPKEVAEFILFLISRKTNYYTGQDFNIDGGDWI